MGVKDLWTVLTPHAERKPICELRGKTVAIDLAGWVCESLNVVDYFVHPRHHLKNLFFRTCYLIWEEVTPVFVLEGVAPKLKSQTIAKRNEIQFRGVKPKEKSSQPLPAAVAPGNKDKDKEKGRTRFNHVLKQCETLLQAMGIQCVQGPGEAEAYCAFLNKKGLVDGVISQDSDCFAYGAVRVYRNFSVSSQGAQAAQGGAVDIYDMQQICAKMDFGQNKIIVMALLCGCDYCPDGVGGVGRDGVLKLFNKYSNKDVLNRVRAWRSEDTKYTKLEMRVDDKTICSNCGHLGRTQSHTKSGCGVCRTNRGCDESLWKEERLSLKAELALRKKALTDPAFPSEEIIAEFLTEPPTLPNLQLRWRQPNMVKFIKQIGHLLQWPEIYCFQKFLPILTRWQVRNAQDSENSAYVEPKEIVKKRTLKGVLSLELIWQDAKGLFNGLIPHEQLKEYELEKPRGLLELWSTVEPLNMLEQAYPQLVEAFNKAKEKPKKLKKPSRAKQVKAADALPLGSLENLSELMAATNDIAKTLKPKRQPKKKPALQLIDKFFKQKLQKPLELQTQEVQKLPFTQCSTPKTKCLPSDLDSDEDDDGFDMSDIINGIVKQPAAPAVTKHAGRLLHYEPITKDLSLLLLHEQSLDDLDLMAQKRNLSISSAKQENNAKCKRLSLDDSFDVLVNRPNSRLQNLMQQVKTHVDRFKQQQRLPLTATFATPDKDSNAKSLQQEEDDKNMSYFFNHSLNNAENDAFEQLMELSCSSKLRQEFGHVDLIEISDSDVE